MATPDEGGRSLDADGFTAVSALNAPRPLVFCFASIGASDDVALHVCRWSLAEPFHCSSVTVILCEPSPVGGPGAVFSEHFSPNTIKRRVHNPFLFCSLIPLVVLLSSALHLTHLPSFILPLPAYSLRFPSSPKRLSLFRPRCLSAPQSLPLRPLPSSPPWPRPTRGLTALTGGSTTPLSQVMLFSYFTSLSTPNSVALLLFLSNGQPRNKACSALLPYLWPLSYFRALVLVSTLTLHHGFQG